jgi:hypothetical protein
VIDEEKLLDLERRHFETLCLLEATFPPSFFDHAASNTDLQNPVGVPHSRNEGRLSGVGTMGKWSVTQDADAFQKAHFTVI